MSKGLLTEQQVNKRDNNDKELKIGSLPLQLQEYAIIEDLLFIMMGIEGKYIEANLSEDSTEDEQQLDGVTYSVDGSLDPSLKDLTERILPLATYYTSINAFVEMHSKFEYGFVNHALCAAMRELLKEDTEMLIDGFHRNNNIPQQVKGGGLLSILIDRMTNMSGKEDLKEDFNDAYWEMRYTIKENVVPPFLIPFRNKILLAGKYLNVIRECGIAIQEPQQQTMDDVVGKDNVDKTDVNVSNDILAAMDGGRSIKRYFFLDQSDFFTHFLDLASVELKKPSGQVSLTKLQSLLDLVLRNPSSVAYTDPFKEDVKVEMSTVRLVDQLLRIINVETAPVSRTNSFSESLGIRKEIGRIGDESEYEGSEDGSISGERFGYAVGVVWNVGGSKQSLMAWKSRVFALRQRMLVFVQQFAYYITNEVLEPQWRNLEANLAKECMLTNAKLLRVSDLTFVFPITSLLNEYFVEQTYSKLTSACVLFSNNTEKFMKSLTILESQVESVSDPIQIDSQDRTLQLFEKFEDYFLYHIKLLIECLNFYSATETVQFLCLVVRLDYNLYFTNK
ncbi:12782_t:CDS:2 [Racocetra fulgida]|uniref:Spindle pole body component n=1 Tax=Racocetra fulgida TaxID=60492 RepID=A0A9N8WCM1_9GLOM|nr:12782_t:CDS:2 [Racocetra fulgida]